SLGGSSVGSMFVGIRDPDGDHLFAAATTSASSRATRSCTRRSSHRRNARSRLSVNMARLSPQHFDDQSADCLCKGVSSNSLRSESMMGTTKGRPVTVTLKVAAGTGMFESNLRLLEGVLLSPSLTRSSEAGGGLPGSCG